ncbi:MAG TPA: cation diffusion facilitator family transporter [Solirubrobacteraceae bacterium]|jgi:cation diffusion facilitator family transporter|nr:cation diffusion facilitator family transporter [Solirubrobacteraceae bacterium]
MVQPAGSEQVAVQRRTTLASIAAAGLLVILKLGVGLIAGSLALVSAGIESSGDVIAAILTFFAVRLGRQPADPEHPYGHGRAENLGALGEAGILLAGGVVVAVEAIKHLISPGGAPDTHWYVFAVIAIALAVDLTRTVVSLRAARLYGSPALRANGLHFAGDMAGSVAVLIGLLLVRAGIVGADAIAALVIAAIILAAAARLIAENANVLMDRTPAEAREAAERALARLAPDMELVRLRLRESAGRYFADVIVAVAPGAAVVEGHQAANLIEAAIETELPGSDVVVHVEPRRSGLDLRDRVLAIALAEPLVKEVHDITIFENGGSASVSLHLKFPADLVLQEALAVAERIEQAIRARPGVSEVQTHLEPMERPLSARPATASTDLDAIREIERIVRERTGKEPRGTKLLRTEAGRVIFLTLGVGAETSLVDAHQLGSELEEELRLRVADIADVVVHTAT